MTSDELELRTAAVNDMITERRLRIGPVPVAVASAQLSGDCWRIGLRRSGLRENLFYDIHLTLREDKALIVANRKAQFRFFYSTEGVACALAVFALVNLGRHPTGGSALGALICLGLSSIGGLGIHLATREPFVLASLLSEGRTLGPA